MYTAVVVVVGVRASIRNTPSRQRMLRFASVFMPVHVVRKKSQHSLGTTCKAKRCRDVR